MASSGIDNLYLVIDFFSQKCNFFGFFCDRNQILASSGIDNLYLVIQKLGTARASSWKAIPHQKYAESTSHDFSDF